MLINKNTGECYKDRKEAKEKLGHYTFNKMVKNQEITFHEDITIYYNTEILQN